MASPMPIMYHMAAIIEAARKTPITMMAPRSPFGSSFEDGRGLGHT